ncbi:MAG: hypothetical protein ABJN40_00135 [Sneathiella sp.]
MQNKLTATWIIVAILVGAMAMFSMSPSQTQSGEDVPSYASQYVIQGNDLSGSQVAIGSETAPN